MLHFYAYLNFWDHPQHNCEYDMTVVPCWSISPGVSGVPNVDASVVQEETGWGAVLHGIVGYCRILWGIVGYCGILLGIVWSCPRGEREWGSTNNPSVDNQIKCTVVLRVNVCMLDGDGWGEIFPQPSIMAMQSEKKDLRKSRQNIKRSSNSLLIYFTGRVSPFKWPPHGKWQTKWIPLNAKWNTQMLITVAVVFKSYFSSPQMFICLVGFNVLSNGITFEM